MAKTSWNTLQLENNFHRMFVLVLFRYAFALGWELVDWILVGQHHLHGVLHSGAFLARCCGWFGARSGRHHTRADDTGRVGLHLFQGQAVPRGLHHSSWDSGEDEEWVSVLVPAGLACFRQGPCAQSFDLFHVQSCGNLAWREQPVATGCACQWPFDAELWEGIVQQIHADHTWTHTSSKMKYLCWRLRRFGLKLCQTLCSFCCWSWLGLCLSLIHIVYGCTCRRNTAEKKKVLVTVFRSPFGSCHSLFWSTANWCVPSLANQWCFFSSLCAFPLLPRCLSLLATSWPWTKLWNSSLLMVSSCWELLCVQAPWSFHFVVDVWQMLNLAHHFKQKYCQRNTFSFVSLRSATEKWNYSSCAPWCHLLLLFFSPLLNYLWLSSQSCGPMLFLFLPFMADVVVLESILFPAVNLEISGCVQATWRRGENDVLLKVYDAENLSLNFRCTLLMWVCRDALRLGWCWWWHWGCQLCWGDG